MKASCTHFTCAVTASMLTACGGSGNDDRLPVDPPSAADASLSAEYSHLVASWAAVPGATSYKILRDFTGTGVYVQVGADLPASAVSANIDVVTHQLIWGRERFAVAACNSGGCTNSNALSTAGLSVPLIGYLKAPDTAQVDRYGWSTALSEDGGTLAVGAPGGGQSPTANSGVVYVYTRAGNDWGNTAIIRAPNRENGDRFGFRIAMSADGNTLAIAAPDEASANGSQANNDLPGAGAIYVFRRSAGTWLEEGYLKASPPAAFKGFGHSLAISPDGTVVLAGAPATEYFDPVSGSTLTFSGSVYLFIDADAGWIPGPTLAPPARFGSAQFGDAAALSHRGERLAVGASGDFDDAEGRGRVHLYRRNGDDWAYEATLRPTIPIPHESFGGALSINALGTRLAVGSSLESAPPVNPSDPAKAAAGAAYLFDISGAIAVQMHRFTAPDPDMNDFFAANIALSSDGNTLVAAASTDDGDSPGINGGAPNELLRDAGAVHVFVRAGSGWDHNYVKASTPGRDDSFGVGLALSGDGNILVVGSPFEDGAAVGLNGNQLVDCEAPQPANCSMSSGAVHIY